MRSDELLNILKTEGITMRDVSDVIGVSEKEIKLKLIPGSYVTNEIENTILSAINSINRRRHKGRFNKLLKGENDD